MEPNRKRLRKSLEKAISKWIDEAAQGRDWIDGYVHDTIVEDMTDAALMILTTCAKTQDYLRKEKLLSGMTTIHPLR